MENPIQITQHDYRSSYNTPQGPTGALAGAGKDIVRAAFYHSCGKRAFDLAMSFVGLIVLAFPMTLISLMILVLDGYPVFFRQERVGRENRLFNLYKFRTMTAVATSTNSISTSANTRITRLGRLLRRFKLDELPQLCNVLCGDMSFVGPRPDVPGYLDRLCGEDRELWKLRPGITGPATLLFRREEELLGSVKNYIRFNDEVIYPEKVRLNLCYMRQCSFALDLGYILATLAPRMSCHLGLDRFLGIDHKSFESRIAALAQKYSP